MKLTEVYTLTEIEERFGIKSATLKTYLNRGAKEWAKDIDYKKSGRVWLITQKAVEKYIDIKKNL
ncbi:MAG: helix-turn-helix domain-containing protein [Sarcina sp.]